MTKKKDTRKRMTTKEIKNFLELEVALQKANLENYAFALPSFDTLKNIEHSRAKLLLCRKLLEQMEMYKK